MAHGVYMQEMQKIIQSAWNLHQTGKTTEAVALLDSEILASALKLTVESIAYNRAQILIDAGRCMEAEVGLREKLQLPLGTSEPVFPSWDLMECLLTVMAIGGGEMDLAVVRWLLFECQDQGGWSEALYYAVILASYMIYSSPGEARQLASYWRKEAERLGEDDHVKGLTDIIRKIEEKMPD